MTCVYQPGDSPYPLSIFVNKNIKKQPPCNTGAYASTYALSTFPDLKQEVLTYIFFAPPAVVFTLTDLTLDFHILLDLLWE